MVVVAVQGEGWVALEASSSEVAAMTGQTVGGASLDAQSLDCVEVNLAVGAQSTGVARLAVGDGAEQAGLVVDQLERSQT